MEMFLVWNTLHCFNKPSFNSQLQLTYISKICQSSNAFFPFVGVVNIELENVPASSKLFSDSFECCLCVKCWFVVVLINVGSFCGGRFAI